MAIVITGSQGFIGSALAETLAQRGEPVISLTRNDFDLPDSDLALRLKGATAFIHIAGRSHHAAEREEFGPVYRNENVLLTRRVLHLARAAGIVHFIYVSSINVNGQSTHGRPFTEADEPNPETPYAQSKKEAEDIITAYCAEHKMDWTILRPPLVYGPNAPRNIGALIRVLHSRLPLPFGAIKNSRAFISITNLCDLIVHCLYSKHARNQLYLATDGVDRSTTELIRILAKQEGVTPILFPFPVSILKLFAFITGTSKRVAPLWVNLQVSPHKLFTQLGWKPKE